MAFKRKASGAWVDPTDIKRRSGGVWVGVTEVKRRISGAWVSVWALVTINLFGLTAESSDIAATAEFNNAGTARADGNVTSTAVGNWVTPANTPNAALYEMFATKTGGTVLGNSTNFTLDTWVALSTTRTFSCVTNGTNIRSGIYSVKVREIGTTTPEYTCTVDLTSDFL